MRRVRDDGRGWRNVPDGGMVFSIKRQRAPLSRKRQTTPGIMILARKQIKSRLRLLVELSPRSVHQVGA